MTALIVVFITLSLMGSALWVMPSKRERQKMALRMLARQHNITVQLTSVELPDKWDKVTHKESVCAYHKYRDKPLKDFTDFNLYPYEVWKYESICKGWFASRALTIDDSIINLLEKYQEVFMAIEVKASGVSLYWREKGDEQTVRDADKVLSSLLLID